MALHRARTVLVAQGMVWAIALTIAPAAIIEGSRQQTILGARDMGTDILTVSPTGDVTLGETAVPRESDLAAIREILPPEAELTAFRWAPGDMAEMPGSVWVYGVDDAIGSLRNLQPVAGELAQLDPLRGPRDEIPIMVEWTLAWRLLGNDLEDPPVDPAQRAVHAQRFIGSAIVLTRAPPKRGRTLRLPLKLHLAGTPAAESLKPTVSEVVMRVVGVVSDLSMRQTDALGNEKGRTTTEMMQQLIQMAGVTADPAPWLQEGRGIYVPRRVVPGAGLDWIMVRDNPLKLTETSKLVERALVDRGRAVLIRTNAVLPVLVNPQLDSYMRIHAVLYWVFLTMGGIVLANIMLLSGQRRQREIAIRRAEGARRLDIFMQFLWEGTAISLVGLVLGTLAGLMLAWVRVLIAPNVALNVGLPWAELFRSWGGLLVCALIASSIPAWRATLYDPVQLLRRGG